MLRATRWNPTSVKRHALRKESDYLFICPFMRLLARLMQLIQLKSCSPEYLDETLPCKLLTLPSSNRKLIVLDLNGTLVYRPKRQTGRTNTTSDGHRQRPAHPRPYLHSFLAYLVHAQTKVWLDSMIWSSAQPHSVTSMIEKCFGDSTKHFLAVWNRKHFELNADQYREFTPACDASY